MEPDRDITCRFCGKPASFVDKYLSPFEEDRVFFYEGMSIYYCQYEGIGFAYPVPSHGDLRTYYSTVYRDSRRLCSEDPHKHYAALKSTPLADSQFMYLSQFIDFDKIQTVIDMGCGHGMLLRKIREHCPNAQLTGIEIDVEVSPFLKEIGAELIQASASASVDAICERVGNDTLLISSHTLHYQDDIAFLRDIIRKTKAKSQNQVHLFIEVPNDTVNNPAYVSERVYDIPKLIFFTVDAFRRGLFDLDLLNVSTNGWTLDQELFFRRKRLELYRSGKKHSVANAALTVGKLLIPVRARRLIRAILSGGGGNGHDLAYFFYGGDRRAIRMIGRIR